MRYHQPVACRKAATGPPERRFTQTIPTSASLADVAASRKRRLRQVDAVAAEMAQDIARRFAGWIAGTVGWARTTDLLFHRQAEATETRTLRPPPMRKAMRFQ